MPRLLEPLDRRRAEIVPVHGIDDAVDKGAVGGLCLERQLPHLERVLHDRRALLIEPGLSGQHERERSQHGKELEDDPGPQGLDPSHFLWSPV